MTKMALKTRKKYVDHIFEKGRDVYDKPFKPYSTNKTKLASILARKSERKNIPRGGLSYGEAKRRGILQRQSGGYAQRVTPVMTGDLKNDAKPFSTATTFGIKFAAHGGKIDVMEKMNPKRVLTHDNQPLPEDMIDSIVKDVDKEMSKDKLFKNETIKIKMKK